MSDSCLEDLNMTPLVEAKTEPPLTRSMSGPQLLSLEQNPLKTSLPGNSIAVERGVRDVTLASAELARRGTDLFFKRKPLVKRTLVPSETEDMESRFKESSRFL